MNEAMKEKGREESAKNKIRQEDSPKLVELRSS
jgi:hypothetical protein